MTLLDKNAILLADDIKTEDVHVPEWGGTVRLKTMTGTERDAWGASLRGPDGRPNMQLYTAALIAACAVGEDGAPIFNMQEAPALAEKSAAALVRLQPVAERLNGLGGDAVETAKGN